MLEQTSKILRKVALAQNVTRDQAENLAVKKAAKKNVSKSVLYGFGNKFFKPFIVTAKELKSLTLAGLRLTIYAIHSNE